MITRRIRVRRVWGAQGKGHRYQSQSIVIEVNDDGTEKSIFHPQKEIGINETTVRMKDSDPKWEIWADGWLPLSEDRVQAEGSPTLSKFTKGD